MPNSSKILMHLSSKRFNPTTAVLINVFFISSVALYMIGYNPFSIFMVIFI